MGLLVGRRVEERQIASLVDAVRNGRTQVLFLTGPPGIGKSRLAGTVASEMPTYSHLLLGAESAVPYGAIDRLIDEQLPESAAALKDLRTRAGVPTFAIGVVNLIEKLDGPFAIVIDDLHHLDGPSQEAFWHVIRRLDNVPALFIATGRSTTGWFAERVIQHITVGHRGLHLDLGPLNEDGVRALFRTTLFVPLSPHQVRVVMGATGGNPGLVQEVIAHLRRGGATLASAIADLGVGDLADDVARIAEWMRNGPSPQNSAAVLALAFGGPLSPAQLDRVMRDLGHGPADLRALRDASLVTGDDHLLKVPAAISSLAAPAEVMAMHRALANTLPGVEGLRHRVICSDGVPDDTLLNDLLTAAGAAAHVRDFELAAKLMAWASSRDDTLLPSACLLALRSRNANVMSELEPRIKAMLPGVARSVLQCALDAIDAGVVLLPLADGLPVTELDDTLLLLLAQSLAGLGRSRSSTGRYDMPPIMASVRDELARRIGGESGQAMAAIELSEAVEIHGLLTLWLTFAHSGASPPGVGQAPEDQAPPLPEVAGGAIAHAATLSLRAFRAHNSMRHHTAESMLEQLPRQSLPQPDYALWMAIVRHRVAFLSGEWDAAQSTIEPVLTIGLQDLRDVGTLEAQALAALIPLCRGEDQGSRMLAHVTELSGTRRFNSADASLLWTRGWAAAAEGDHRTVVDSFGALWASPLTGRFAGVATAVLRVRSHIALNDQVGARMSREQMTTVDVAPGALPYVTHHIEALLAAGAGDRPLASTSFMRAHAGLQRRREEDTPHGLQLLGAVLAEDWARFLLDADLDPDEARPCLDELSAATGLLMKVGARTWAERLQALQGRLSALIVDHRQALPAGSDTSALLDAFTPREREIAGLVLDGCTNKEIAQELFVSIRTVEFHVRNALAKLGVSSRVELRALMQSDRS